MQLDIYLPKEKLAFEYQGEHHFYDIYSVGESHERCSQRDEEKMLACLSRQITLIEIPYWWDFQKSSLIATICRYRNDLVENIKGAQPIPLEPPEGYKKGSLSVSFG